MDAVLHPDVVRRLLMVRPDNLGDVVLLAPALRALRALLPDAHLTLLASPAGALAGPLLPCVDEVRTVSALWQDASGRLPFDPGRERALIADLDGGRFDAAVISTSFSQSPHPAAYACYLAGIPVRAAHSRDFAGSVLSDPLPEPPVGTHQAERALDLVTALGARPDGADLRLQVPTAARERAAALRERLGVGTGYVVAAPGASCSSRRYPPDRFARALRLVQTRTTLPVLVAGSGRERPLTGCIAAEAGAGVHDIGGCTDVAELAALIDDAALVVTNNSGCLHLADALRTPIVVLFAGTERRAEYGPRSAPHRVLGRATWCTPCRTLDCPYDLSCLDVAPAAVAEAADALIGARP